MYVYIYIHTQLQRVVDKSFAQLGRKQAAPVRSVMAEEWVDLVQVGTGGGLL
jgi:hypothetical protein